MKKIPITDIRLYTLGSEKEKLEFIKTFGKALQEFGFVIVDGHEISDILLQDCYTQFRELFLLPLEKKLQYVEAASLGKRGYVSFGLEHAKNNNKGDLKEFWHIGREYFEDKKLEQSYAKNIWPEINFPNFKNSVLDLYASLDQTALTLLSVISEYLGIPKNILPDMAKDGNSVLRALHYPPISGEQFISGATRAAPHEDINLITLLCEATEGGLEIKTRQGEWIEVQSQKGQMIVDSGDMLSRITNGIIPSTTHRVVNPKNSKNVSRYSMPFFVHAFENCELRVLEECITPSRPAQSPPILANEFLLQRLKEIGLGENSLKS